MTTQSKLITLITDGYRVDIRMIKSYFYIYVSNVMGKECDTTKPTFGEAVGDIFRQIKGV